MSDLVENPKNRFSHEAAQFETAGQTDREREREREREERREEKLMIDDRSNHFLTQSLISLFVCLLFVLISAQKHRLYVLARATFSSTHNLRYEKKIPK